MAGALSIFQLILYPLFLSAVQCCWERGQMVAGGGCSGRGEYTSKKIWNCLPWILGYFETVCLGQPENLQNCLSRHKVNFSSAMLKNMVFPRKHLVTPPPGPVMAQRHKTNRYPPQRLAIKVQYKEFCHILRGGFSLGPVRAPRHETNGTLLKSWL